MRKILLSALLLSLAVLPIKAQQRDTTTCADSTVHYCIEMHTEPLSYILSEKDLRAVTTKRNVIAFRTNLLLPLLNSGLEVPIARHFSIAGDIYYPWIGYDKANANCIQALLADVQLRWWIRPKKIEGQRGNTLTGSAISLGAYAGYYDFERDMKGFQGEIGCLYLDYSYTFFLARSWRLSLSVGAGIARMTYRTYTVYSEGGKLIRDNAAYDMMKQWVGPVHAGLVLTIPVLGGKRNASE